MVRTSLLVTMVATALAGVSHGHQPTCTESDEECTDASECCGGHCWVPYGWEDDVDQTMYCYDEAKTLAPTKAPTKAPVCTESDEECTDPSACCGGHCWVPYGMENDVDQTMYCYNVAKTLAPTEAPTKAPTDAPTDAPTGAPTDAPTEAPTKAPVDIAPVDACATFSKKKNKCKKQALCMWDHSDGPTKCASMPLPEVNQCGQEPIDLIFVVDSSGSVTKGNYARTKSFVRQIVGAFTVGDGELDSRIASVSFSDDLGAHSDFTDDTATDVDAFGKFVSRMPRGKKTSNVPLALFEVERIFATTPMRAKRAFIVITDGNANRAGGCKDAGFSPKAKTCTGQLAARMKLGPDGEPNTEDDAYFVFVRVGGRVSKSAFQHNQDLMVSTTFKNLQFAANELISGMCDPSTGFAARPVA